MDDTVNHLQSALGERYRVERELGRGGMATVYLAEDLKHRRRVAIKVLRPELAQALGPKRFLREIEIAARLSHPGILPVHDSGEGGGLLYYVMPYVEGESLRDRLNEGRQLSIEEALRVIGVVADALAYAHSRGLVHRDIKPENILFQAGHAMVSDFGIARVVSAAGDATLTEVGVALGTPRYMSPEQAVGESDVDHRTDIYAVGVVAYEMLAGQPPFVRDSARRVIAAHISEAPRNVGELRADIPAELALLIMRCLEKDPSSRPQSAEELLAGLASITSGELAESAQSGARVGQGVMLGRALAIYVAAFFAIAALSWVAMIAIGLPGWVFPGILLVMAAGLPAIFLTAWVHREAQRTPTGLSTQRPPRPRAIKRFISLARPYATWRRTSLAGATTLGAFALGVGGYMTMRTLGIGTVGTLLAAGVLQPNWLLVADFKVSGLDAGVGSALAEAARTALSESRAVSVLRSSEMADALHRMQRPPTDPLDLAGARELAVREGIPAIVHGEVTPLGSGFLVSLRLIAADSGHSLFASQANAAAHGDLLQTVDKLSRKLRSKIGESLKTVRASPPLETVTTPSLDALQKYTEGISAIVALDAAKAVRLQEEAVRIDPGFAMAWRALAVAWANAGFGVRYADSGATMAFKHRDRLTERERAAVEAYYYLTIGRDRAKAARAYEAIWGRDSVGFGILASIYMGRREFARAESLIRSAIARDSSAAISYTSLVDALASQGKIAQAESTLALATTRFGPRPQQTAMLLFMKGQLGSYERLLDSLRGSSDPRTKYDAVEKLSAFAILRGRIADYERYREESRRLRAAIGLPIRPNNFYSDYAALIDIEIRRQPASALRRLDSTFASVKHQGVLHAARAYAFAGRPDRARALMERLLREVQAPSDSANRRAGQPFAENVWATIALAEGRHREAITRYRKSDSLPDGPAHGCAICPLYDLGTAFEAAGEADSAIAMFEAYVRTPSTDRQDTRGWPHAVSTPHRLPLVYERLGKLYEGKGNRSRAAYHYGRFVDLWKDADPELQPRVAAARNRIAALQGPASAGR